MNQSCRRDTYLGLALSDLGGVESGTADGRLKNGSSPGFLKKIDKIDTTISIISNNP
jgi:hypothetical protein